MARKPEAPPVGGRRRLRVLIAVGAVVFLLLDVVLIGFALNRNDTADPGETAGPIPTFGVPRTSSATPTPDPTVAPAVAAQPRYLVATGATTAWRSTVGNCTGQDAVVESTSDGGLSWQQVTPPGVHEVLQLSAEPGIVTVIARTGDGCGLDALKSFTDGEFWKSYSDQITAYALVDPADRATVHSTTGVLRGPCPEVRQVQERGDAVVVVCDGQLFESTAAAGWLSMVVPGLLAETPSDDGYTLAISDPALCAGVSVQSLPAPIGGAAPAAVGCAPTTTTPAEVTVARSGSTVWLWSADRVFVSSDGGATWGQ